MDIKFEFATANRIVFGAGRAQELPELARAHGTSVLLVVGRDTERAEPIRRLLLASGISAAVFSVPHEPTLELIAEGAAQARLKICSSVIAIGGGSVMDAGKAIAALATNRRPILDYLEVIGKGEPLDHPPLKTIAIPTTAGSGAEVTRNAVLTSAAHKVKVSLRHAWMLPNVALIDPELTRAMPPTVTAATGLDALSQLIEPFVCSRANPMTDSFCREGIDLVARSLRAAFLDGQNRAARADMSLASLLGGLALANSGLGAVHGFAAPIGAAFNAPHGAVCAALLPVVMRVNIRLSRSNSDATPSPVGDDVRSPLTKTNPPVNPRRQTFQRFEEIARRLTGNPAAKPEDGADWVEALTRDLQIPPLSHYGLTRDHFPELVAKAKIASSMRANPVPLSDDELTEILLRAI